MNDIIVRSGDSAESLKRKAEGVVGGQVQITERAGGEKVVHMSQDQSKVFNRMSLEDRRAALGGSVRQNLND